MKAPRLYMGINLAPPGPGNVLVLNYYPDGASFWVTPEQAYGWVEFIVSGGRPKAEWGSRLEKMRVVEYGPWWESATVTKAYREHDSAVEKMEKDYQGAMELIADYLAEEPGMAANLSAVAAVKLRWARLSAQNALVDALSQVWGPEYPIEEWLVEHGDA